MAALSRHEREQEDRVTLANALERKAKEAAQQQQMAALHTRRHTTKSERRLSYVLDSVKRPLGGPSDAGLVNVWRAYERARPMGPLHHWLAHGRLPSSPSSGSHDWSSPLMSEPLGSLLLEAIRRVQGPLAPEDWQAAVHVVTTLEVPTLVQFGCTCHQLHERTHTDRIRLQSAVKLLRKLSRELRIEPLALRHAVGLEWKRYKPVPLIGERCERLAGMLFGCTSLVALLLDGCALTDASMQTLLAPIQQNALPRLRELRLNENPQLGDVGVSCLAAVLRPPCSHCGKTFPMDCNSKRMACPSCGGRPPSSRRGREATPLLQLRSLELRECCVGDVGTTALATALAPGCSAFWFRFLALGADGLGEAGASALARSLDAGGFRVASEHGYGRMWVYGDFSTTCGDGFTALTAACDRHGVLLELDHGIPWGA
jgi:hypothetical protein